MKLDIIYRCYNKEVEGNFKDIRPPWFNKIKCLETFVNAVEYAQDSIGKVIFLHDGPKGRLFDSIPSKFEIVCINHLDDGKSLMEAHNIADNLNNHIYFAEDDYIHLKESIQVVYDGLNQFKLLTPYDHLDRYIRTDDITYGKEFIAFSKKTNRHWRTAESTCNTWASTREMWNGPLGELAKYYRPKDRELFRALYQEHNIRLWNPIPGVTTQVDQRMSPGVDWQNII